MPLFDPFTLPISGVTLPNRLALAPMTTYSSHEDGTITDEEAKAHYKKNPEIRTSHIFIGLRPDATVDQEGAARKRLIEVQESLKKGASFAALAQTHSEGPAAPMGGDIDYKTRESLDPAYYNAALELGKPGKVSGIVRTPFGLHLIKLTAVREWDDADISQVKRQIFDEKRAALFEKFMGRLRNEAKVSVNTALLK
jgi:peptidyl-prolyl cis-trans isomerase C/peptidyl-prolyl cis-trans isomerase D